MVITPSSSLNLGHHNLYHHQLTMVHQKLIHHTYIGNDTQLINEIGSSHHVSPHIKNVRRGSPQIYTSYLGDYIKLITEPGSSQLVSPKLRKLKRGSPQNFIISWLLHPAHHSNWFIRTCFTRSHKTKTYNLIHQTLAITLSTQSIFLMTTLFIQLHHSHHG